MGKLSLSSLVEVLFEVYIPVVSWNSVLGILVYLSKINVAVQGIQFFIFIFCEPLGVWKLLWTDLWKNQWQKHTC